MLCFVLLWCGTDRFYRHAWWRHQMEAFSALLAICAGNSPVPGEFPAQKPVTRSFDVFFDLRLNKRLSKQMWGWWFETLSCPLWRHCNVHLVSHTLVKQPWRIWLDISHLSILILVMKQSKTKKNRTGGVDVDDSFPPYTTSYEHHCGWITGKLRITGSLWGESSSRMDSPPRRRKPFLVIRYPCHGGFYLTSVHHRTLQEASNYPWHLIWCW